MKMRPLLHGLDAVGDLTGRASLALFEAVVRMPMQQLGEARLAQRQGQRAQAVAFHRKEGSTSWSGRPVS
jgi:hypothetical protein